VGIFFVKATYFFSSTNVESTTLVESVQHFVESLQTVESAHTLVESVVVGVLSVPLPQDVIAAIANNATIFFIIIVFFCFNYQ
jgi:hypothetical protein